MPIYTYLSDIIDHQRNIDKANYERIKGMIISAAKHKHVSEEEYKSLANKLINKSKNKY